MSAHLGGTAQLCAEYACLESVARVLAVFAYAEFAAYAPLMS